MSHLARAMSGISELKESEKKNNFITNIIKPSINIFYYFPFTEGFAYPLLCQYIFSNELGREDNIIQTAPPSGPGRVRVKKEMA